MSRVVHFEVHAENPERAASFYTELFGWQFTKWEGPIEYWMIVTGEGNEGINGGLTRRRGPAPTKGQPLNAYSCTVDVADLDASLAKSGPLGAQVALPKMAIPGVGWLAYIIDTEGNILGLMQNDPAAK
jgi:predicted enzyme related to lactoylglutathione lyase